MTDRERFESRAVEVGAQVVVSEPTRLVVIATNGILTTEYIFDKDGHFVSYTHTA